MIHPTERELLDQLIAKAIAARSAADRNCLTASPEGYALVNAMFDLTHCDALYELAGDIAHDADLPHEPSWQERGRAVWQPARIGALIHDCAVQSARTTPVLEAVR